MGAERDHTQIIGFRFNALAGGDAADGIYTVIANTIAKIPIPGSLVEGDSEDDLSSSQPGVIVGASVGVVGAAVLAAAGVVTYRRRRNSKNVTTTTAFASSTSSFSRKFSKKQMARGSVTLSPEMSSENPAFVLSQPSTIVLSTQDMSDRFAV